MPLTSQAQRACPALRMLIAPTRSAFSAKPHSTHSKRAWVWRLSADTWPQHGQVRLVFCGGTTMSQPPFHAIFIRAPLIERTSAPAEAIARLADGTIVAAWG